MSSKISPRLLPEDMAVSVTNTDLDSGSLRPLKGLSLLGSADQPNLVNTGAPFSNQIDTLFQARTGAWFGFQDVVSVMDSPIAEDAYDRVYFSGKMEFGTLGGPHITSTQAPTTIHFLGLPKPDVSIGNGGAVSPQNSANEETETAVSRSYCSTFVTARGEEGPPSPPTPIVDLRSDQTITLTAGAISGAATSQRNIALHRVYRTDASGVFRRVADMSATSSTSLVDTVLDSALGEELVSQEWNAPPAGMLGICSLSNGICAGFTGQTVCFSEAYLPHAWPTRYQLTTHNNIVAILPLETGLLVMTEGKPYIVQGADPAGMVMTELNVPYPISNARSAVDVGGKVIYASEDGLVIVSSAGASLLTESLFTSDQWFAQHNPSTIQGFLWEGKYVGFHDRPTLAADNGINGFIIDPRGGKAAFTRLRVDGTISNGVTDQLRLGYSSSKENDLRLSFSNSSSVYRFGTGSYLSAEWQSRHYYSERPINIGVGRVSFGENLGAGDTQIAFLAGDNNSELIATDVRHTETVDAASNTLTFRMASGYKSHVLSATISTKRELNSISFAESPSELK